MASSPNPPMTGIKCPFHTFTTTIFSQNNWHRQLHQVQLVAATLVPVSSREMFGALLTTALLLLAVDAQSPTKRKVTPRQREHRASILGCSDLIDGTNRTDFRECIRDAADDRCFRWNDIALCIYEDRTTPGNSGMGNNGMDNSGSAPSKERRDVLNNCTEDYVECVRDRYEEDLSTLPSCVRQSLQALAECSQSNAAVCADSCQAQRNSTRELLNDLPPNFDSSRFRRCGPLRGFIFRPLCRRASCCPQCYDALQAVSQCFLDEVLEFTPRNGTCQMNCFSDVNATDDDDEDESRVRHLSMEEDEFKPSWMLSADDGGAGADQGGYSAALALDRWERHLVEIEVDVEDSIYEACIELAPGISSSARGNPDELVNQLEFFDCVMDEAVAVITDDAASTTPPDDTSSASSVLSLVLAVAGLAASFVVMSD